MKHTPLIIVRGCGDIGSAIAHLLFLQGAQVILHDERRPAHTRRGMAFTDALFDGNAMLEGVEARCVTLSDNTMDAARPTNHLTVMGTDFDAVVSTHVPDVLVDARMRKRDVPDDQRHLAELVVGLGPGFTVGLNCSVAIETAWGDDLGALVTSGSTSYLAGEPRLLDAVGRERFVYAARDGIWQTHMRVGDAVSAGQQVAKLAGKEVYAPLIGTLRGLSHDGVSVVAGQKVVEVDPRANANVFGIGMRPRAIARGVSRSTGLEPSKADCFFGFEGVMEQTLDCMPMRVRMTLDLCGRKVSLAQWRTLPLPTRETILLAHSGTDVERARITQYLLHAAQIHGLGELAIVPVAVAAWCRGESVPQQVSEGLRAAGLRTITPPTWLSLSPRQRFALVKLTRPGHTRNLQLAMQEFGIMPSLTIET